MLGANQGNLEKGSILKSEQKKKSLKSFSCVMIEINSASCKFSY